MKRKQKSTPEIVVTPPATIASPEVSDKPVKVWQHACHPHVYQCMQTAEGILCQMLIGSSLVGEVFTVPDLETLKLPNMGR